MSREISFRLVGHASPDGSLLAADAEALSRAFQTLMTRLTRSAADRPGRGRPQSVIEALSRVRLSLRPGSTVVAFSVGDPDALDVDPLAPKVDEDFRLIVEGMRDSRRPEGTSDSIADAVDDLVGGLKHAARLVDVSIGSAPVIHLVTSALDREIWRVHGEPADSVTYVGRLEAVDLASRRFRLQDDAGNRIALKDVHDVDAAGRLVGTRVTATGVRVLGTDGRLTHLLDVVVDPLVLPSAWRAVPVAELLTGEPSPSFEPLDVSDDELDAFFAAIRG
jgi:hypothetical protein